MRRVHVPAELLAGLRDEEGGRRLRLQGSPHRHLARVLRLEAGASVLIFDGEGHEYEASIVCVARGETILEVGTRHAVAPPACTVVLLQALARGERMDLAIQKTTELGVGHIVPFEAARSLVRAERIRSRARLDESGEARGTRKQTSRNDESRNPTTAMTKTGKLGRWRTIATEAARQCGRADIPRVDAPVSFAEALRLSTEPPYDEATRILLWEGAQGAQGAEGADSVGGAHGAQGDDAQGAEDAAPSLLAAVPKRTPAVVLAIGPEGGFTDEEAALARRAGFIPVSLGPRILRTETAAIAAVAVVQAATGALQR